jgi:hypothetical protein
MTNTNCCEYSIKIPDVGTVNVSEKCGDLYQNKFVKYCILLALVIRIYQNARSYECQTYTESLQL